MVLSRVVDRKWLPPLASQRYVNRDSCVLPSVEVRPNDFQIYLEMTVF